MIQRETYWRMSHSMDRQTDRDPAMQRKGIKWKRAAVNDRLRWIVLVFRRRKREQGKHLTRHGGCG